ncbi:cytospin-B isoform X1 [Rissa tridactyla]|uniref:cytospin-B isoform X1 n=1 Tax=Rissa tridactyla TaxID=75485 RepID=UPI0023BA5994|nr:cytospin-B isoform X1 [Rissa tridactyla]XP_054065007.1 cytospin-B isoform X1 [Rissa tridactyla]XP_054065008.1 cytospin-B isoform X1 [Rissa tridactyla]XP_054065009.1 cytospin-B isoform X1 [Rissa tridactyla]XP_054065010.1 cytospin-B isoform X1 [Rissa tridactyla]XP_054065011.1 cytospin-B isoform X1 [Rissa tridactyla]XP_054065012.1 cytospin-B isoform X1 [Rissa tridactyla]
MKSTARPWSAMAKQGSHGVDRGKPLSTTSTGMKTSKSSTSLAFESRLSKLKRASSDDMLTKPGVAAASGVSRLKKTITTGAISELAESRLKPSTGTISAAKRTGIPAPREISSSVSRERAVLRGQANTRKTQPSPTSSGTPTPTKHVRPTSKSKQEHETGDKAVLESQVKELLAEAKTKDSEITKLRCELKKCKEKGSLNAEGMGASNQNSETVSPVDIDPLIRTLQEKNRTFQKELASLGEENRVLKEKLLYLENSPLSDTTTSSGGDSSLPTPTTQESSFGSPSKNVSRAEMDEQRQHVNGGALRNSGSSSSDVTKASLSPDASDFEHIADVPSRPTSSNSNHFKGSKCSTTGSSPNNISDLSVASLTERIQKMEENHHSTAEELQATLQELSDQQQMVQELTTENEKLVEEKALLETSFRQHRDRAEQLSQENEKLMTLLQERSKNEESRAQEGKVLELEQKCAEVLEKAQFEREKLLNIQQQLTSSLRSLEREHQDAQQVIKSLREENEKLLKLLEVEQQSNSTVTKTLEDCKIALEGLKIENGSLKTQLESEKQKAAEINAMGCTTDNSEVQEMLKVAHAEKDQLEATCTELKQELLKANSELKHIQGLLSKAENECGQLKEVCDRQAEQLSRTSQKLQEKTSENEADIKNLKETIFELEDQVEQHRAIKLHNNQLISDLESKAMKLEEQKQDTERQLKALTKQMKEDTEEWRRFQADLQTAVVVANDIKCEAQQELRVVKRKLQEEEEKTARLQKELDEVKGSNRLTAEEVEPLEADTTNRWQGVCISRASPTPSESAATVKSLIKSFDLGCSGSTGQNITVHKVPRSPLSGIPVRTAPAAAVSPMQRHSVYNNAKPASKGVARHTDLSDLPLADLLKGRNDELKPDHYLRKSPSLESLSKPPMAFSSRMLTSTPSSLKPQSKLSVERKDPLAALAREYGGSKRNALLKWCQKKTEGYQNIDITNFSSSWSDGLAFCALLHTYLPAHIPYQELNSQDKKRNLLLAFQAAESVGIKPSLELSEMMYTDRPDWQSVMQYVAQIYKYFET